MQAMHKLLGFLGLTTGLTKAALSLLGTPWVVAILLSVAALSALTYQVWLGV
jgi:hypothetical protein